VRLAPAAVILLGRRDAAFETGYAGLGDLWAGLVEIRDVTFPRRGGGAMGGLHWWEYDVYIGHAAAAWLAVFGGLGLRCRPQMWRLAVPMLILALLSIGPLYAPLNASGLPLLASQRVSSRFLILPLGLLAVIAAIATEEWRRAGDRRRVAFVWAIAVVTGALLLVHSHTWSMANVEARWPPPPHERDVAVEIVAPPAEGTRDALYVMCVRLSAAVSASGFAFALWRVRRVSR
jgi:hypothetical protein